MRNHFIVMTGKEKKFQGGLYPTVAVSDAFNVAGHLYAALIAVEKNESIAATGFIAVALAGFIGVLRFGFSESLFSRANGDLADIAAFVGLPLVGLSFMHTASALLPLPWGRILDFNVVHVTMGLVWVEAMARSFPPQARELTKIFINLGMFVGPAGVALYMKQDYAALGGVVLFVLAGLVITADRHRYILGVRCENWFHYAIGVAAPLIAMGL